MTRAMNSSENLRNTRPEKVVPRSKRSKKAQRAHHALRRADWNAVTSVTRVIQDKTKYNRKQDRELKK